MTADRIEELYKSGAITFQEAIELGNKGPVANELETTDEKEEDLPASEKEPLTKEKVVNMFIENILEPETVYENGEYVTYDFIPLDEVLDYLKRNNILWRGEKPTIEMIKDEIKSLTKDALSICISQADEGSPKEDCSSWVEGTCFRADAYFDGDSKDISVDVRFVPHQGFQLFDYEKY